MKNKFLNIYRCLLTGLMILCITTIHAEQVSDEDSSSSKPVKLGTTFSWSPTGVVFYDAPRFKDSDIRSMLENAIIDELKNKGYIFSEAGNMVDFYISYVVILEDKLSDDEIAKITMEYPEINPSEINTKNFEYGGFIISASTVAERVKLWENSTNSIVNLKMSDSERKDRLKEGAIRVLESFPKL
jgi:hypothetical protein